MKRLKFIVLLSSLLFVSTAAFAQFDGGMGGGFPPMGMGPMGQESSQSKSSVEGVDLSKMSVISDEQSTKLIEQLKKSIEKHNKKMLSKFDKNKNGQLDKDELKAWKKWLSENGTDTSDDDATAGGMGGMRRMRDSTQVRNGAPGFRPQGNAQNMPPQGQNMPAQGQNMPAQGQEMPPMGGGMGQTTPSVNGTAASTVNKLLAINNKTLTAEKADESVIKVAKDGKFTGTDLTLKKVSGDTSSGGESNFYGLNAAFLTESGATSSLNGGSILTNAEGANAVFAYGKEAKINIDNLNIETQKNSSRGLDATFGGTIIAKNVTITTKGAHCAALATDRGEGTVTVTNCNGTTHGEGSPGIYSTGNISASNSLFYATGSEAAVIEGKNSIKLSNCTLTGTKRCGVMLYQSFSGDAGVGTSVLTMKDSKMTAVEGPMFYCTNTRTKLTLENNELISHTGSLLKAEANQRWGQQGKNGAQVTLETKNQVIEGTISVDNISSANITFGTGTCFTGAINTENQSKQVNLTLVKGFKWVMTADTYIQKLTVVGMTVDEAIKTIQDNGHKLNYATAEASAAGNI